VSETRGSTELGKFSVSTAGLAVALNQLQMHCNETDAAAAAAVKVP
jgi:hypothetical protein